MFHYRDIQSTGGAVAIVILSPKGQVLLVLQRSLDNPFWKIPVESRKRGERVLETASRGAWEELGLTLRPSDFQKIADEDSSIPGRYRPHICVAMVSQAVFDSHSPTGNEDGEELEVREEKFSNVPMMSDFLERHHYILGNVRRFLTNN